jgi:predicted nucleotidyltransferase
MWLRHPLDDIVSSRAKVAVLRAVSRVGAPLSGREIIRRAGVGYSSGWRALQALVAAGLLSRRHHGRVNTYELRDRALPLVQRLRDLFAAENRRAQDSVADLAERVPEALSIVLFGSEARGDAESGSDTDLLVVVPHRDQGLEDRIRNVCMELAEKHDLALSWEVADLDDLHDWQATGDPFWASIRRDGILLHGDSLETLSRAWQPGKAS